MPKYSASTEHLILGTHSYHREIIAQKCAKVRHLILHIFAHFVTREIGDRRARQESILQSIDDQMARH